MRANTVSWGGEGGVSRSLYIHGARAGSPHDVLTADQVSMMQGPESMLLSRSAVTLPIHWLVTIDGVREHEVPPILQGPYLGEGPIGGGMRISPRPILASHISPPPGTPAGSVEE